MTSMDVESLFFSGLQTSLGLVPTDAHTACTQTDGHAIVCYACVVCTYVITAIFYVYNIIGLLVIGKQ